MREMTRAHTGRVRAFFCKSPPDQEKPEVTGEPTSEVFAFFTNGDAGMVYDHLRKKYPEHNLDWLFVEVLDEVSIAVQREVAGRKINTAVWRHRADRHPVQRLNWIGERPEIEPAPNSGPLSLYKGTSDRDTGRAAELLTEIATVFGEDRFAWT